MTRNKKPKSTIYLLLNHPPQETSFTCLVASEDYKDLEKEIEEYELYVCTYQEEFDLTKEYLDKHKQQYLAGDDYEMYLAAETDGTIPANREMFIIVGIGNEWCWEASVLGAYSTLEDGWKALAKELELSKDDDSRSWYSYDEYKKQFYDNVLTDNLFIYWKWLKVKIGEKND